MKKIINFKFLSFLLVIAVALFSCVQDDDFDVPPINSQEPINPKNTEIQLIKDVYNNFEPVQITPESVGSNDPQLFIEGYVVSNDEAGNFFKTLVIQDKPENPTAGIAISTERTDLYTFFEPGRKIYFRVDGLYSGEFASLPTIGTQNGTDVGRISIEEFNERISRSLQKDTLVPTVVTIGQALGNESLLNTLVQFENVQFPDDEVGEAYASTENTFSVNRTVQNCDHQEITLRNSGFADFRLQSLPGGNGTITAVLSVFNTTKQIFIRETDDVNFNSERCMDEALPVVTVSIPFMKNFEGQTAGIGEIVNIEGWANVNVVDGTTRYEVRSFSNNKYAQIRAFATGENPVDAWLITPGLDLTDLTTAILNFETKDGFNNGAALTVSVSTDYTGFPEDASWTDLNPTLASGTTSGIAPNFTSSGNVSLAQFAGKIAYVRFRYLGGDGGVTTTFQIDNVSVTQ